VYGNERENRSIHSNAVHQSILFIKVYKMCTIGWLVGKEYSIKYQRIEKWMSYFWLGERLAKVGKRSEE